MKALLALLTAASIIACDRDQTDDDAGAAAPTAEATASSEPAETAPLRFRIDGQTVRVLTRSELEEAVETRTFTAYDPYYEQPKTYRALPVRGVLELGFAGRELDLQERHFVLHARDGYTVPIEGERLLAGGAHLAIEDRGVPGWEPIGRQQANPGPYYLVWSGKEQTDLERYPRPWQLAVIEVVPFEEVFPHVVPEGEPPGSPARRGFAIFREQCIRCHAINRQGGRVGPDLNVPQNILEYRPEKKVRAYIADPETFRYSKMPSFSSLEDAALDALIAYLRAMGSRKRDRETDDDG